MRIALIEDDQKIAAFVRKGLTEEHYSVDVFNDGADGAYWAAVNDYDLVILDVMLPNKDGFEICSQLRSRNIPTPILMLTAKTGINDRVRGLDSGADDYLTKPFAFVELLARVRALLRRTQTYKTSVLSVHDLRLDPASHHVSRGDDKIQLSGKEYALLEYLMRNTDRILTESMIIEHVWDMNFDPDSNIVKVYIHYLREKIDKGRTIKLIHTVRGLGYTIKNEDTV
ncbi:MAG: heavy metal response regulator transcription factor [bacterium]|nr:heavy metal response regulator transcription factor [bacterium]